MKRSFSRPLTLEYGHMSDHVALVVWVQLQPHLLVHFHPRQSRFSHFKLVDNFIIPSQLLLMLV